MEVVDEAGQRAEGAPRLRQEGSPPRKRRGWWPNWNHRATQGALLPCFGGPVDAGVADWQPLPPSRRALARELDLAPSTLDSWSADDDFRAWLDYESAHWLRFAITKCAPSPRLVARVLDRAVHVRRLFGLDPVPAIEAALLATYDPILIEAAPGPMSGS